MDTRKTRKRKNVAGVSKQMPGDEQLKRVDATSVIVETDRLMAEVTKTIDLINSLSVEYDELLTQKKESDLRATAAEQRVDELRELLKAKQDELAFVNDKLVEAQNPLAGAS